MVGVAGVRNGGRRRQDSDHAPRTTTCRHVDVTWYAPVLRFSSSSRQQQQQIIIMADSVVTVIRVILAILLPPLGVFLRHGIKIEFWICLILSLLAYLPGIIYAIWVIVKD
ncbi:hypothetical protein U9M48_007506 [Paspalum notatum var. saurae]|uniref:Uncharacterized protein n=1 Tax=Paspalum notatum var. saurae TaxID=547442 RepID=A0AAQ3PUN4_PASNO